MPSVSGKGKRPTVIDDVEERGSEDGYGSEAEASSSAQPQCPASPAKSGSDPGDFTCAICLGDIKLEEMAMVKGCDHIYCGEASKGLVMLGASGGSAAQTPF